MKYKLSFITLLSMISVAAIFSAVLIYNMTSVSQSHIKKTEKELRLIFIKSQKESIRQEINRLISRIQIERAEVETNAKMNLQHRVYSALDFIHAVMPQKKTKESVSAEMRSLMDSYHWEYEAGYYFALDSKGKILFDGGYPQLEGKNVFTSQLGNDLKSFAKNVYDKGEAYGTYSFHMPGVKGGMFKKLAFGKYDPKTGLLIGACLYKHEIDEYAKKIILSEIKEDTYGFEHSGYFMIFTPQYKTIYHPSKEFSGSDLKQLRDADGKYLIRNAVNTAIKKTDGFITYKWQDPVTKKAEDKVSYVKYLKDWNWIIGTGFYFTSFNEMAASEQKVIMQSTRQDLKSNIILIFGLLALTVFISLYIRRRLKAIEAEQIKNINDLEQYKNVMDETSIVSMTDPAGHMIYVNDKFCQISGYTREFLLGKKHNVMRHPDTPSELFKELWTTITAGNSWQGIIKNLRADGSHFYHNVTIIPYKNEHGRITHYTSCSQDITELMENRETLQNVFTTDRLTGLNNRYKLLNDLSIAKMPALALLDIDRFHEINELYGMQQGDELLTLIADKMLAMNELKMLNIYRLHSDVFAVMAPYMDMKEFTEKVTASIKSLSKDVHILNGKEIFITFRIGFAGDRDDTAAKADIALQMAKSQNLDHVIYDISNISNADSYEKNIRITKLLNDAIENDRVVPFFQPIYNLNTGVIDKYECLIRIINEDGSILPPAQFLDISKQTRLYPKLTSIVAKKSIDTFRNIDKEFSINISDEDLLNTSTMEYIFSYAKDADVISRMCIELLETEQLSCSRTVTETISRFKKLGAKIAIDDFGTGYSNFDYLLKIKADYIKIDGSIIKLITKDDRAVDIVNSIVRYARKMGLKTIGEFVSDKDIAIKARLLKIDYAQGYYFGKPEKSPAEKADNQL